MSTDNKKITAAGTLNVVTEQPVSIGGRQGELVTKTRERFDSSFPPALPIRPFKEKVAALEFIFRALTVFKKNVIENRKLNDSEVAYLITLRKLVEKSDLGEDKIFLIQELAQFTDKPLEFDWENFQNKLRKPKAITGEGEKREIRKLEELEKSLSSWSQIEQVHRTILLETVRRVRERLQGNPDLHGRAEALLKQIEGLQERPEGERDSQAIIRIGASKSSAFFLPMIGPEDAEIDVARKKTELSNKLDEILKREEIELDSASLAEFIKLMKIPAYRADEILWPKLLEVKRRELQTRMKNTTEEDKRRERMEEIKKYSARIEKKVGRPSERITLIPLLRKDKKEQRRSEKLTEARELLAQIAKAPSDYKWDSHSADALNAVFSSYPTDLQVQRSIREIREKSVLAEHVYIGDFDFPLIKENDNDRLKINSAKITIGLLNQVDEDRKVMEDWGHHIIGELDRLAKNYRLFGRDHIPNAVSIVCRRIDEIKKDYFGMLKRRRETERRAQVQAKEAQKAEERVLVEMQRGRLKEQEKRRQAEKNEIIQQELAEAVREKAEEEPLPEVTLKIEGQQKGAAGFPKRYAFKLIESQSIQPRQVEVATRLALAHLNDILENYQPPNSPILDIENINILERVLKCFENNMEIKNKMEILIDRIGVKEDLIPVLEGDDFVDVALLEETEATEPPSEVLELSEEPRAAQEEAVALLAEPDEIPEALTEQIPVPETGLSLDEIFSDFDNEEGSRARNVVKTPQSKAGLLRILKKISAKGLDARETQRNTRAITVYLSGRPFCFTLPLTDNDSKRDILARATLNTLKKISRTIKGDISISPEDWKKLALINNAYDPGSKISSELHELEKRMFLIVDGPEHAPESSEKASSIVTIHVNNVPFSFDLPTSRDDPAAENKKPAILKTLDEILATGGGQTTPIYLTEDDYRILITLNDLYSNNETFEYDKDISRRIAEIEMRFMPKEVTPSIDERDEEITVEVPPQQGSTPEQKAHTIFIDLGDTHQFYLDLPVNTDNEEQKDEKRGINFSILESIHKFLLKAKNRVHMVTSIEQELREISESYRDDGEILNILKSILRPLENARRMASAIPLKLRNDGSDILLFMPDESNGEENAKRRKVNLKRLGALLPARANEKILIPDELYMSAVKDLLEFRRIWENDNEMTRMVDQVMKRIEKPTLLPDINLGDYLSRMHIVEEGDGDAPTRTTLVDTGRGGTFVGPVPPAPNKSGGADIAGRITVVETQPPATASGKPQTVVDTRTRAIGKKVTGVKPALHEIGAPTKREEAERHVTMPLVIPTPDSAPVVAPKTIESSPDRYDQTIVGHPPIPPIQEFEEPPANLEEVELPDRSEEPLGKPWLPSLATQAKSKKESNAGLKEVGLAVNETDDRETLEIKNPVLPTSTIPRTPTLSGIPAPPPTAAAASAHPTFEDGAKPTTDIAYPPPPAVSSSEKAGERLQLQTGIEVTKRSVAAIPPKANNGEITIKEPVTGDENTLPIQTIDPKNYGPIATADTIAPGALSLKDTIPAEMVDLGRTSTVPPGALMSGDFSGPETQTVYTEAIPGEAAWAAASATITQAGIPVPDALKGRSAGRRVVGGAVQAQAPVANAGSELEEGEGRRTPVLREDLSQRVTLLNNLLKELGIDRSESDLEDDKLVQEISDAILDIARTDIERGNTMLIQARAVYIGTGKDPAARNSRWNLLEEELNRIKSVVDRPVIERQRSTPVIPQALEIASELEIKPEDSSEIAVEKILEIAKKGKKGLERAGYILIGFLHSRPNEKEKWDELLDQLDLIKEGAMTLEEVEERVAEENEILKMAEENPQQAYTLLLAKVQEDPERAATWERIEGGIDKIKEKKAQETEAYRSSLQKGYAHTLGDILERQELRASANKKEPTLDDLKDQFDDNVADILASARIEAEWGIGKWEEAREEHPEAEALWEAILPEVLNELGKEILELAKTDLHAAKARLTKARVNYIDEHDRWDNLQKEINRLEASRDARKRVEAQIKLEFAINENGGNKSLNVQFQMNDRTEEALFNMNDVSVLLTDIDNAMNKFGNILKPAQLIELGSYIEENCDESIRNDSALQEKLTSLKDGKIPSILPSPPRYAGELSEGDGIITDADLEIIGGEEEMPEDQEAERRGKLGLTLKGMMDDLNNKNLRRKDVLNSVELLLRRLTKTEDDEDVTIKDLLERLPFKDDAKIQGLIEQIEAKVASESETGQEGDNGDKIDDHLGGVRQKEASEGPINAGDVGKSREVTPATVASWAARVHAVIKDPSRKAS